MIKKGLLITLGVISLILGTIGIVLPLLPTTPFLLLSAACFFRSSSKLYNYLINNRYLGVYIRNYQNKQGIPLKIKIIVLSLLWTSIIYTIINFDLLVLRIILCIIALIVTYHILKQKTLKEEKSI